MKQLKKAIEYLPDYPGPTENPEEKVLAEFSHMRPDEEIDAWGMSRATGVEPLAAEQFLNQLVQEGLAVKEGNWYSMNIQGQLINKNDHEKKKTMVANAYKKAIKTVFEDLFEDKAIEASVWPGDPYDWAEGALTTIEFEHGLESPYYNNWLMEKWFEVDEEASRLLPFNVFNELVNPSVTSVWEA
jgi:hypothetical protein